MYWSTPVHYIKELLLVCTLLQYEYQSNRRVSLSTIGSVEREKIGEVVLGIEVVQYEQHIMIQNSTAKTSDIWNYTVSPMLTHDTSLGHTSTRQLQFLLYETATLLCLVLVTKTTSCQQVSTFSRCFSLGIPRHHLPAVIVKHFKTGHPSYLFSGQLPLECTPTSTQEREELINSTKGN